MSVKALVRDVTVETASKQTTAYGLSRYQGMHWNGDTQGSSITPMVCMTGLIYIWAVKKTTRSREFYSCSSYWTFK
jgi:hypothetical protein